MNEEMKMERDRERGTRKGKERDERGQGVPSGTIKGRQGVTRRQKGKERIGRGIGKGMEGRERKGKEREDRERKGRKEEEESLRVSGSPRGSKRGREEDTGRPLGSQREGKGRGEGREGRTVRHEGSKGREVVLHKGKGEVREGQEGSKGVTSPRRVVFWGDPVVTLVYHGIYRIPQFRSLRKLEKAVIGRRV